VNVDEHEPVADDQRSIAGDGVILKPYAVHLARDAGIVDAIDFGRCEEKRRARFEYTRHARERRNLITAWEVKHHPPRNRGVEAAVCERREARVAVHYGRARQVDPDEGKHACGAVESNDAMAGVYSAVNKLGSHVGSSTRRIEIPARICDPSQVDGHPIYLPPSFCRYIKSTASRLLPPAMRTSQEIESEALPRAAGEPRNPPALTIYFWV
jgi:hypothetical protein